MTGFGRLPSGFAELFDCAANEVHLLYEVEINRGETLSLADISVFVQLSCIRSTDEGEKILAAQPTVLSWMERVDAKTS